MSDIADKAQAVCDMWLAIELKAMSQQLHVCDNPPPTPATGRGALDCVDCGDPIGAERLASCPHTQRCVECQGYYEQERKQKQGKVYGAKLGDGLKIRKRG
ncbi:MAG: hypothetical protein CR991_11850 [Proteobacteria bacterium]|nr:MAG: hypothetical protein CR991_11850 [Pseudomonadota bacterium]